VICAAALAAASARAAASGALQPIETQTRLVEDAGVTFVVRWASSLAAKAALRERPARADPLGDYEPDLFVADLPPAHYALLNKFPVCEGHVLVVTRAFEDQERLLTPADFAVLAPLLAALGGLAFYNGGAAGGASQARKHLQLAQTPLPMEALIKSGRLPFRHAFAPLTALEDLHRVYCELLAGCGIAALAPDGRQSAPYNLLLTRGWMLVVPRSRERFESISVNALGFAGSLFVREPRELELVRRRGPMNVLRAVAIE
jgi:ATP adenylyltransferase